MLEIDVYYLAYSSVVFYYYSLAQSAIIISLFSPPDLDKQKSLQLLQLERGFLNAD